MNYPNLNEEIRINFFGPQKRNLKSDSQKICAHFGSFTWDGFNKSDYKKDHRVKYSQCDKWLGTDVTEWE